MARRQIRLGWILELIIDHDGKERIVVVRTTWLGVPLERTIVRALTDHLFIYTLTEHTVEGRLRRVLTSFMKKMREEDRLVAAAEEDRLIRSNWTPVKSKEIPVARLLEGK